MPLKCFRGDQQPYFLDFEGTRRSGSSCQIDRLGKKFESSRDIKKSQEEIDQRFLKKMTDWTERFRDERKNGPTEVIKLAASNELEPLAPVPQNRNPHSFWGINNSSKRSVQGMSEEYLLMKQAQERTQLEANAHNYSGLSEEVKAKQAVERMQALEWSNNNQVGGTPPSHATSQPGLTQTNQILARDYVTARPDQGGVLSGQGCLNAQGEWMTTNPQNYLMRNKYAHLKKLDPSSLNQMQGKPVADDCQPPGSHEANMNEDVFSQTSWNLARHSGPQRKTLEGLNQQAMQRILSEKSKLGSAQRSDHFTGGNLDYSNFK